MERRPRSGPIRSREQPAAGRWVTGWTPLAAIRLLAVVGATSLLPAAGAKPPSVRAADRDNNGMVRVAVGGTLVVRLDAQLETGYGWEVAIVDRQVLEPTGTPIVESIHTAQPGVPEQQVFEFRAVRAGSTPLELHYRRPWEKDVPPQKVFSLRVEVR